jgi:hypothetical protein
MAHFFRGRGEEIGEGRRDVGLFVEGIDFRQPSTSTTGTIGFSSNGKGYLESWRINRFDG